MAAQTPRMPQSTVAVDPSTGRLVDVYVLLIAALCSAVEDLQKRVKALEG